MSIDSLSKYFYLLKFLPAVFCTFYRTILHYIYSSIFILLFNVVMRNVILILKEKEEERKIKIF